MLGLVLALASSACWGVSDFVGGLQSRRVPVLRVVYVSQAAGLIVLAVVLAARGVAAPALAQLWQAALGGLAGAAGLAAFYRGLAIGSMSIVAPIAATGVSIPVIAGIIGGERPGALKLAGIVAAVVGVLLASREEDSHRPPSVVGSAARISSPSVGRSAARTSVGLALVSAAGFGCFFLGLHASARADPLWATLAARVASVAALSAVAAASPALVRGQSRGGWGALVVVGTLDVAANVLYAVATRHGLLSIVSVMASLYPLGTVALARILLGERVGRIQEAGVVAALTGVLLIAAG